ncbi:MAG: hypothetical protein AVDCRST_MAG13-1144, partial [uncultured Solirubrobacteraceae bacterium]
EAAAPARAALPALARRPGRGDPGPGGGGARARHAGRRAPARGVGPGARRAPRARPALPRQRGRPARPRPARPPAHRGGLRRPALRLPGLRAQHGAAERRGHPSRCASRACGGARAGRHRPPDLPRRVARGGGGPAARAGAPARRPRAAVGVHERPRDGRAALPRDPAGARARRLSEPGAHRRAAGPAARPARGARRARPRRARRGAACRRAGAQAPAHPARRGPQRPHRGRREGVGRGDRRVGRRAPGL